MTKSNPNMNYHQEFRIFYFHNFGTCRNPLGTNGFQSFKWGLRQNWY